MGAGGPGQARPGSHEFFEEALRMKCGAAAHLLRSGRIADRLQQKRDLRLTGDVVISFL